jgi:hypothetical protein
MTETLETRIRHRPDDAGYGDAVIRDGIAYADCIGFSDDDEALSIVVAHILYGEDECERGARFPVEPGTGW